MQRVRTERDPLDWILNTDMHTYLPDDELRKTDRLSMWHSLEVRVPFLDHKFVEFVATIPSKYKLNGHQKKYILIRALKGIVPDTILHRRKQGFSIPLANWLRGPLRDLVRSYLSASALKEAGLFDSWHSGEATQGTRGIVAKSRNQDLGTSDFHDVASSLYIETPRLRYRETGP